jgi:hypothetical protein
VDAPLSNSPHWWQWPTILSLDAPAVAVAWQCFLATLAGHALGWPEGLVLGVSVWLAYVADRWFEGWRVAPAHMRTQRHRFYQRYRWGVALVWIAALGVDLATAFFELHLRELLAGAALLAPAAAYVLSHQLIHRRHPWRVPKEVCIALLLAGGAAVFVVSTPGAAVRPIIAPLVLFAGLCFANVALIAVWEQEVDEVHGQTSLARQFGGAAGASRALPWIIALVAALCLLPPVRLPAPAAGCVVASAILLGLLDRAEARFGWQLARVLADAALLTPIIPLLLKARR